MISFRYHIVTIVAVFLALGLGVLAGTTVIDQQIVDGLRAQIVQANRQVGELQADVDALSGAHDRADSFIRDSTDPLIANRL
ncbi:MAG: copper transporter, partial [Actinomycetota bacterium]